jgi:DNA-binding beta-propeller fold protein YncE
MRRWMMHAALRAVAFLLVLPTAGFAQEFRFRVVASGLARPLGLTVEGSETIYFSQVPTPGVPGANSVVKLDLESGEFTVLHKGEPEPTNLALDREGNLYWTCKSAGVILVQSEDGVTRVLLRGLHRPSGIAVGRRGVYFTEVPTPGVVGGANDVVVFDGTTQTILHAGEPEPTDIVVAKDGTVYWTCRTAGVILAQSNGVTRVLASGLDHPTGIALDHKGEQLYFTEVPTPGVPGSAGGRNTVSRLDLKTNDISVIHSGDPEPTDVAVARNGNVYWTCTSAGVIVEARLIHH